MNIVIADGLPTSAIELLQQPEWTIDNRQGRPAAELMADLKDADALVVRSATKVTREMIDAAPKLRVIARAGTGVDNVDVPAATARGIVVMNAPGANSLSVAELAMGLILSMARNIPAADASMKTSKWEKAKFAGAEIRSKTLGLVGLGRIGQEVAARAQAFEMKVIAHDPFILAEMAATLGVELVSIDGLCARADYISLHLPALPSTKHIFNAQRFAKCKKGVRIVNTARGELIDETALADAIEKGHVAGAGLDVFDPEPPKNWRLAMLPQVVATPHIAASTREAQEQVGSETAAALRDFLKEGIIRNAVNFPSVSPEAYKRLRPYLELARSLGLMVAEMGEARIGAIGVRYYGELAAEDHQLLGSAVLEGVLSAILSSGGVTPVNARTIAMERGIELIESRSTRSRNYTSLISVKLQTDAGERWVEGTVFANGSLRLVLVDGVAVESPLEGTLLIIRNNDQPGVIGDVGTLLGRHKVNIANFALGRDPGCLLDCAIGVVKVDEYPEPDSGMVSDEVLAEIRAIPNVRSVWRVQAGFLTLSMAAFNATEVRGVILYDGTCGFCSWWVPYWQPTLARAGFKIAPLQSPEFSRDIDLDAPESWDLTLMLPDGHKVVGADAYRHVMRRVWWAYPFYLLASAPGLERVFNWSYTTFAQNRYCVSRACGLDARLH